MAQASGQHKQPQAHKNLGRGLLALYLGATILLIGLIWVDNLTGDTVATPGYIRDSFIVDENIYATVTAEAKGLVQETATPTLTVTPSPISTPEITN